MARRLSLDAWSGSWVWEISTAAGSVGPIVALECDGATAGRAVTAVLAIGLLGAADGQRPIPKAQGRRGRPGGEALPADRYGVGAAGGRVEMDPHRPGRHARRCSRSLAKLSQVAHPASELSKTSWSGEPLGIGSRRSRGRRGVSSSRRAGDELRLEARHPPSPQRVRQKSHPTQSDQHLKHL